MGHAAQYKSMEDLAADDDLLSDILLDHLEWEPPITTHKMNPQYRSPRFDTDEAIKIVHECCIEREDVQAAVERVCQISVVKKHLEKKTESQKLCFAAHARRYLECYLPESGIEFALTMRYKQSPSAPLRSRRHRAALLAVENSIRAEEQQRQQRIAAAAAAAAAAKAEAEAGKVKKEGEDGSGSGSGSGSSSAGGAGRSSSFFPATAGHVPSSQPFLLSSSNNNNNNASSSSTSTAGGIAGGGAGEDEKPEISFTGITGARLPPLAPSKLPPGSGLLTKADLCLLAVRPFKPGDIIGCKGGITDLTPHEDEALREEAAHVRASGRARRRRRRRRRMMLRQQRQLSQLGGEGAAPEEETPGASASGEHGEGRDRMEGLTTNGGASSSSAKARKAGGGGGSSSRASLPRSDIMIDGARSEALKRKGNGAAAKTEGGGADASGSVSLKSKIRESSVIPDSEGERGAGADDSDEDDSDEDDEDEEDDDESLDSEDEDEYDAGELQAMREHAKQFKYKGVLGAGRDFSVVHNERKNCSQLFLGPARFVNHDCEPNVEFYRIGHQMTFRVIRPIAINEEITTFYGDSYFEDGNAKCLCATCEQAGKGAFTPATAMVRAASNADGAASGLESEPGESEDGGGRRKPSARQAAAKAKRRANRPVAQSFWNFKLDPAEANKIKYDKDNNNTKDGNIARKLLEEPEALLVTGGGGNRGPERECVTCGAHFWSRERWWKQEECHRCERHYRIFKADWPERIPTEDLIARSKGGKPMEAILSTIEEKAAGEAGEGEKKKEKQRPWEETSRNARAKVNATRRALGLPPLVHERTSRAGTDSSSASSTESQVVLMPPRSHFGKFGKLNRPYGHLLPVPSKENGKRPPAGSKKSPDTDEDAVEASLGKSKGKAKASSSSVSSLTSESLSRSASKSSTSTRVSKEGSGIWHCNWEYVEVTSSEESADEDEGPAKLLGKAGKTETLALYWGATDSSKRTRRKSNTAQNPLQVSAATVLNRKPEGVISKKSNAKRQSRSSASIGAEDRSRASSSMGPARKRPRRDEDEEEDDDDEPVATGTRKRPHMVRSESEQSEGSGKSASSSSGPELATEGIQRTSVNNLALAWGLPKSKSRDPTRMRSASKQLENSPRRRGVGSRESSRAPSSLPDIKRNRTISRSTTREVSEGASPGPSTYAKVKRPPEDDSMSVGNVSAGSPTFVPFPVGPAGAGPGAIPLKQPSKKNLRWGKGKVSLSRPDLPPPSFVDAALAPVGPRRSPPMPIPTWAVPKPKPAPPTGEEAVAGQAGSTQSISAVKQEEDMD